MPLIFTILLIILVMLFTSQPIRKFSIMKWLIIVMMIMLIALYIIFFINNQ